MSTTRTQTTAARFAALALLAAVGGAAGCNAVLGLDERTLNQCSEYCRLVMGACTGADRQYDSPEICAAACATMEPGEVGETQQNTVGCRLTFAEQASAAADDGARTEACRKAGFSTLDAQNRSACGDACQLYCNLMPSVCPGAEDASGARIPPPGEECASLCDGLAVVPGFVATDAYSPAARDTLNCRLWHLANATEEASPHCTHAAGGDLCIGGVGE